MVTLVRKVDEFAKTSLQKTTLLEIETREGERGQIRGLNHASLAQENKMDVGKGKANITQTHI